MRIEGYDIHPLTPDRWEDFEALLGKGGLGGCWYMYWIAKCSADWGEGQKGGSSAKKTRIGFVRSSRKNR